MNSISGGAKGLLNMSVQLLNQPTIKEGVKNFDVNYINYLLAALGVNKLHYGIGFGNPKIEFVVGDEFWSTEIKNGGFNTKNGQQDDPDLIISISREEAVRALLASDIKVFMKKSVVDGRTKIQTMSGKAELLSKGYLSMYEQFGS